MNPPTPLPLPHDIPLPLPVDRLLLDIAMVFLFLAHILFVNFMVGGSTLTLVYEVIGLRNKKYDALARRWSSTITVNKSLAVVLGVAPLLVINVLYTLYIYTANSLTGSAWMMLVPLVIAAFLLGYLHNYTWDRLAQSKGLHIFIGAMATAIFWMVPLIFLANVNLMLFPERWTEVQGFLSAVLMQNVLPRYLHFILASLAISGLFGAAWFGRAEFDRARYLPGFERAEIWRRCYEIAFGATLMQFVVGTLVYFTLPASGISFYMTTVTLIGVTCAFVAVALLWSEIVAKAPRVGRFFAPIVLLLSATVGCMATGRHLYREGALSKHRDLVMQATEDYQYKLQGATWRKEQGLALVEMSRGERVFQVCTGCHALDSEKAGPSVREIQRIYPENAAGIVAWAKSPGKKRTKFAPMPAFAHLPETDLQAVAEHMLAIE
jgi:cytochrome c